MQRQLYGLRRFPGRCWAVFRFPLCSNVDLPALSRVVTELQAEWPCIQPDAVERNSRPYGPGPDEIFLMHHTSDGLIQINPQLARRKHDVATFSLRFAYCNPRTVYEPFCALIEWLMRRYHMFCHNCRDLAPEQRGLSDDIDDPADVRRMLVPSMDYNRALWQLDFGREEAAVRPDEALVRFVLPHCVPAPDQTIDH